MYLRELFLRAKVGVSGANFGVAETGTICVVESEGNGRMCTTLPPVLVSILGIEKLVPRFDDLEVFLQLLPRSSTGERMNPYTSLWTGVTAGDGPQELHVVLLDNGRTRVLAGRGRPAGAALHPLQRLPQRVPGVHAHGRARVRLGVPRPDRRDPDAAARSGSRTRRRCRTPRRSAARATRCARSRSTSRACSCTCAARRSGARPLGRVDRDAHRRVGLSAARAVSHSPSASRGSRSVPFARKGSLARLPPTVLRLDAFARPEGRGATELPHLVGPAMTDARTEVLARITAISRKPAPEAPRGYRDHGDALADRGRRALLRAGCRLSSGGRRVGAASLGDRDRARPRGARRTARRHPLRPPR